MSDTTMPTPRGLGEWDAPHASPLAPMEDLRTVAINRVSWGAVLAGIVMSLVTQLVLAMIGIGVGIAAIDYSSASGDAGDVSMTAGIWWAASGVIAAIVGGLTAGRLSG